MKQPKPVEKYIIKRGMLGMEKGFTIYTDKDARSLQKIDGVNDVFYSQGDEWQIWTSERYSPDEIEAALHEAMQGLTKE